MTRKLSTRAGHSSTGIAGITIIGVVLFMLVWLPLAEAHKGPLDDRGCHRNRQTGWYHCHEGALKGKKFANRTGAQRALKKLQATRAAAAIAGPLPVDATASAVASERGSLIVTTGGYGPYAAAVQQVLAGGVVVVDVAVWPGLTQRAVVRLGGLHLPRAVPTDGCEEQAANKARAFVTDWVGDRAVQIRRVEAARDGYGMTARITREGADLSQALIDAGLAVGPTEAVPASWCR